MRALIQRVREASVSIDGLEKSSIHKGLLILLGIEELDQDEDIKWICGKIARLRIFNDKEGLMNLSLADAEGEVLVISQFTLHASTKKGNRPSFVRAAKPEKAIPLYKEFVDQLEKEIGKEIKTGEFGTNMQVGLLNDGPVTILIDSKNRE